MPTRIRAILKVSPAIFGCLCSLAYAETAVVRSSYENPVYPAAAITDTNLVAYGVVGGVGGTALNINNYRAVFDAVGNITNSQFILTESQLSAPSGSAIANYGFGDVLRPPEGAKSGVDPVIEQGEDLVVWLDYAGKLLALDSGVAVVKWEMEDGTFQTMTYAISPNPQQRPVRIYWTDDINGNSLQNGGPTVQFGSNYKVDLYPSSLVSINTNDYQWVYDADNPPSNDVWLTGNSLHAKEGTDGKFLLTYSRYDELGYQQYIAHEVVEVLRPMSELQQVHVGDRLIPIKRKYEVEDLFSLVSRGASDPAGGDEIFVYKHNSGIKNGWVWATRETDAPGQIEIYWKAKEQLDVIWPFEVDIYKVSWGDNLQKYVRGDLENDDFEPAVYIPQELSATVMDYQTRRGESGASSDFAFIDNGALYTTAQGKFMLRYSTEDTVWFEPVEAVAHQDLTGAAAEQEIATEITVQDTAYTNWPGYCYKPSGTAYNTNFYAYPKQYTDPKNITSSIFGVNRGELEVWWANESKFWTLEGVAGNEVKLPKPVFFPSKVNSYTNVWPTDADQIVIASGMGSAGLTPATNITDVLRVDSNGFTVVSQPEPGYFADGEDFTVETWFNLSENTQASLFHKGDSAASYWSLEVSPPYVRLYSAGYVSDINAGIATNDWVHITLSRGSDGYVKLFINGAYRRRYNQNMSQAFDCSGGFDIGQFNGLLDEVRVWDYARSASEIQKDMRLPLEGDESGLAYYASFNLGEQTFDYNPLNRVQGGRPAMRPNLNLLGTSPELYVQGDKQKNGYNPNEEHALIIQDIVYALRSDLNITNGEDYSSQPFVLVEYEHDDGKRDMAIYEVVVDSEFYKFEMFRNAGQMIQAPAPLNQLQPAWSANNYFTDYGLEPFKDRNGWFWAQRAGDDGGIVDAYACFYYPNLSSFWYPEGETHEAGDLIAWAMDGSATPKAWDYIISWPQDVPQLNIGATLTNPRDGLPAVRGQLSVDVVYQQSEALSSKSSVKLIDPTRAIKAEMAEPPAAIKNFRDPKTGYTFFGELPPALRTRMFWNGTAPESERLQLKGEYKERTDGHNYLLLNVLSQGNRANALDPDIVSGAGDEDWVSAIDGLPENVEIIENDETPVDSYALSTIGKGAGYVTLIFNDSTNTDMVDPSEVIDMAVIRVDTNLYQGRLDTLLSPNPLDKQITLKYTADFAGEPVNFELEWNYADPDNGSAPDEASGNWKFYAKDAGLHYTTVGDSGIFGLSDHYLRCRYRALDPDVVSVVGTNWSSWTPPQLCEGWIKRVLKAVNPYEQRIRDYMNYELDSSLSMIQQAGAPYDGDIPLNYGALNDYGLIQIYQTLLGQARDLSIDAGNPASAGLSLSLMMAAGRLADLYMLLGNEAYADALNPLVSLGSDDPAVLTETPSIFCFENQVPDLLTEELCLLRGRDDSMNPPVTEYPIYNRLAWNFTADIIGGEVAYALNYGISDLKGNLDGSLNAADAAILFPQGHGDAWGHYLTAVKGYYELMHHDFFNWYPQVEGILVGDTEVTVSYLHEKKFVRAAAAKARTGLDIIGKTRRQEYAAGADEEWGAFEDSVTNRAWGVGEWASRAGQGTYFDWLTANSLLPSRNSDPDDGDDFNRP